MLLPTRCPVCGAVGPAPCDACRADLRRAPSLPTPPGVDRCAAVLAYEGAGRELIARLKYRNARASVRPLASAMAALVDRGTIDVVTWVPTTPRHLRQRGFDHGRLLAVAVARRLGVPARRLLTRLPGPAQTGQPLTARRAGPRLVSAAGARARVLVVDDVVTTGATATTAARVLRGAGAQHVQLVAAARTPRPH